MSAHLPHGIHRKSERIFVAQILVPDLLRHRRIAHDAIERNQHREEKCQLIDRRHLALDEHRALVRIDADRQPIGRDIDHALANILGLIGAGGKRMFVGDQEKAFILILQRQPIFDAADVVAEMRVCRLACRR